MKKIFFLFAAVMSLLAVGCRDVLLEKNIGGFSVSFQTPGSSSRAGTTATWKLEAWLELESGAQLQKKDDTVPANAPITITFDAVPIGTKLKVQVRLEDSENSLIQHEGSSDWITVDAESKTVEVQVQRKIVNAAAPSITTQPQSQSKEYQVGDEVSWSVTLTVAATSEDGGELSYQWFKNTANSNSGGTLIPEATKEDYQVTLTLGETKYFYCVVTNTNDAVNGTKTASNVAKLVYDIDIAQSGVLLWDSASVKIAPIDPYGNYDFDAATSVLNSEVPPVWCFDNTGNLYVLNRDYAGMRYDLKADGTYQSADTNDGNYPNSNFLNAVSYDNVTGILYGITDAQIKKLTPNGSDPIIDSLSNHGINDPVGFAVHGGSAYVANQSNEDENGIPSITIVSFDLTTQDFALGKGTEFKLPTVFDRQPTYQMIYQEGALYLLLGCVKDSTPNISSVGAVAKIDAKTLSLDTSFGQGGYLGLVSTVRTPSYNDTSGSRQTCSVYAASSSTDKVFSRPLGFVAIMPKKLVIADAGCIVYDEVASHGDYPKLKGDAVSRIVTVDLETQSLGFDDLAPNQYYRTSDLLGSSVDTSSAISSGSL